MAAAVKSEMQRASDASTFLSACCSQRTGGGGGFCGCGLGGGGGCPERERLQHASAGGSSQTHAAVNAHRHRRRWVWREKLRSFWRRRQRLQPPPRRADHRRQRSRQPAVRTQRRRGRSPASCRCMRSAARGVRSGVARRPQQRPTGGGAYGAWSRAARYAYVGVQQQQQRGSERDEGDAAADSATPRLARLPSTHSCPPVRARAAARRSRARHQLHRCTATACCAETPVLACSARARARRGGMSGKSVSASSRAPARRAAAAAAQPTRHAPRRGDALASAGGATAESLARRSRRAVLCVQCCRVLLLEG